MKKNVLNRLSFKIGSMIVLTEIVILSLVSFLYVQRFSNQIDKRIEDRVKLVGTLVESSLVRLISIRDSESLQLLVGEEIVDALIVDAKNQNVIFAFNSENTGASVQDVSGVEQNWFGAEQPHETLKRTKEGDNSYMVSVTPLSDPNSGATTYFLYIKTSTNEAEAEKASLIRLLILGSIGTVLGTFVVLFLSFRFMILVRIADALGILGLIEQGDLSARITRFTTPDEIGVLQSGVNSMAEKRERAEKELTQLNQELEKRVEDRTRELQVAADVSKRITVVLEIEKLLQEVVTLVVDGFALDGAFIFRLDEEKQVLNMAAGANAAGDAVPHETIGDLPMNTAPSIVTKAARTHSAVVVNDVSQSPDYLLHSSMPETRSEVALPILLGDHLIGILDLQSHKPKHFGSNELRVLQSLAEQLAVAMRNAELYSQAQIAREAAESANHVKSQFLASMSHELRTPLNGIINFTRLVADGVLGTVNEKQTEILLKSVANSKHLLALINDVLDISKIESGSLTLLIEDNVNINQELEAVIGNAGSLLQGKPVELIVDIEENLPLVRADRRRVRQILLNLVSNACKFTDTGSVIISAHHQNEQILFAVKDTGPGIAPEDHDAVFETFRQTETGLRKGGGTGLGLPISKRLTEAHGGKLWLESVPGEGSTFYVSLLVKSEALQPTI
ncbi:MAG: GAF domain-containing protein [Anaerolineae bacterium]|nr:GAF domain-containing protein [Anaerolineae bacterium]